MAAIARDPAVIRPSVHHPRLTRPRTGHEATIELDDVEVRAGEVVRGRVHVVASGDAPVSAVVELQVAGRGEVSAVGVAASAPVGEVGAGQRRSYPFALVAPALPPPFAGTLFRTEIRLAAVLARPGAPVEPNARAFPAAVQPIRIEPTQPLEVRVRRDGVRTVRLRSGAGSGCGVAIGAAGMLAGIGCCALGPATAWLLDGVVGVGGAAVLAGAVLLLVGGYILWNTLGNWRAERVLGVPEVTIEPVERASGPALAACVRVGAGAPVERVTLQVRVDENVQVLVYGDAGPQAQDREREVATAGFELAAHAPGHWRLEIPTSAFDGLPLPLELGGNNVYWWLALEVHARGRKWRTRARLDAAHGERWVPTDRLSFTGDRPATQSSGNNMTSTSETQVSLAPAPRWTPAIVTVREDPSSPKAGSTNVG